LKGLSVAILGSGGREAALAWKLRQEVGESNVWVLPGNPGIAGSKNIDCMNGPEVLRFCKENHVELVVVGPEAPLAAGVSDFLRENNVRVFGPSKRAAELETSKIFAKRFMNRHGVQTAPYALFTSAAEARTHVGKSSTPCVIKYDGLAAGKGVYVCENSAEALSAINELSSHFGENCQILVEEKLKGSELSLIVVCDGKTYKPFPFAQDHKRLLDGNRGPNTGGMGACAPVPGIPEKIETEIFEKIVAPTLNGLAKENFDYRGFLYFGIMLTSNGPYLLEYNARMGDPETQALMPCVKSSLYQVLNFAAMGKLSSAPLTFHNQFFAAVVFSCEGYALTGAPTPKPQAVNGLSALNSGTLVFHSATAIGSQGEILAQKGRAFVLTSGGNTPQEALQNVYAECAKISFSGHHYRRDIGCSWQNPLPRIEPLRLGILVSGAGSNMNAIIESTRTGVLKGVCDVAVVASDLPNAPALKIARSRGIIASAIPRSNHTRESFERSLAWLLRDHKVDVVVLAGFMRILSPLFISEFRGRIVNIHPADTKQHRGSDGYEWALKNNLSATQITVHMVDEGLDTGPILAQAWVDLQGAATISEVKSRGLSVEHRLYSETLREFCSRI
jgi:phosphoribosylamine--glycine ligase